MIELAALTILCSVLGVSGALYYRRQQDVLYGPYIEKPPFEGRAGTHGADGR